MSRFDGVVCCLGCMAMVPGVQQKVVSKMAFVPPPACYRMERGRTFLKNADGVEVELPQKASAGNGSPVINIDSLFLTTSKGNRIPAFHFCHPKARSTIIFSHGNSTDIGYMFPHFLDITLILEVNVLGYEYSGYGSSTGEISEAAIYSDIQAAYDYVVNRQEVRPSDVVLYGQSVGSAASVDLASKVPVGGLIVHSGIKSGLTALRSEYQDIHWFDPFKNLEKIKKVSCPLFVIHGSGDSEVKVDHGKALFEAAPSRSKSAWWVRGAGHNDIEVVCRSAYFQKLAQFLSANDFIGVPPRETTTANSHTTTTTTTLSSNDSVANGVSRSTSASSRPEETEEGDSFLFVPRQQNPSQRRRRGASLDSNQRGSSRSRIEVARFAVSPSQNAVVTKTGVLMCSGPSASAAVGDDASDGVRDVDSGGRGIADTPRVSCFKSKSDVDRRNGRCRSPKCQWMAPKLTFESDSICPPLPLSQFTVEDARRRAAEVSNRWEQSTRPAVAFGSTLLNRDEDDDEVLASTPVEPAAARDFGGCVQRVGLNSEQRGTVMLPRSSDGLSVGASGLAARPETAQGSPRRPWLNVSQWVMPTAGSEGEGGDSAGNAPAGWPLFCFGQEGS